MIVTFTNEARLRMMQPNINSCFTMRALPYHGPGKDRYYHITGSQLLLAGVVVVGSIPVLKGRGYIVDKSLLQIH